MVLSIEGALLRAGNGWVSLYPKIKDFLFVTVFHSRAASRDRPLRRSVRSGKSIWEPCEADHARLNWAVLLAWCAFITGDSCYLLDHQGLDHQLFCVGLESDCEESLSQAALLQIDLTVVPVAISN